MDSSLLLLLIILLAVCGYIYYSMTDTFKVKCTKNKKLKKSFTCRKIYIEKNMNHIFQK